MPIRRAKGFLPLYIWPEPILQRTCERLWDVHDPATGKLLEPIGKLAADMISAMRHYGGIGLAANQVGFPYQLLVAEVTPGNPVILINPRVIERFGDPEPMEEGCLSFPGVRETVPRYRRIRVAHEGVERPNPHSVPVLDTGENVLLAQVIQHEREHLLGRNFRQRR